MTLPYTVRLVCLCLASSFLALAAASILVAAIARAAIDRASRMPARSGARLLLALRLLPGAAAAFAAAALCAPSYLWLEPEAIHERVGAACLAAAALGAGIWIFGIARASRAAVRSARRLRTREAAESGAPVLLLAGVLRPRLVVSRAVREALSAEELDAALRHESAHAVSHDNLKRLLMLLTTAPAAARLEAAWRRMAERAADDAAVAGSPARGLALASALLKVARMGIAQPSAAVATSLLGDANDLAARIDRLLSPAPPPEPPHRPWTAIAAVAATAALVPAALPGVHRLLEFLAR